MTGYSIQIDEEVWQFLKKHAEPFEDSPNSVLRKILLGKTNGDTFAPLVKTTRTMTTFTVDGSLPEFPHGTPKALMQILEVIYGVKKLGLSRTQVTNLVAQKRQTDPQTIYDKYGRQLGKKTFEFDQLLYSENFGELQALLEKKFATHRDVIKQFFSAVGNENLGGARKK